MHQTKESALAEMAGINPDNYHDWKPNVTQRMRGTFSKSELHYLAHNPHQWHARIPKEYRACMKTGSLVDMLMTEPHKFEQTYVVTDEADARKKVYLDAKKEAKAYGKTILKRADLEEAEKMIENVMGHPEGRLMARATPQPVFTGAVKLSDMESGEHGWMALKIKPDYVQIDDGVADVWDLKCTGADDDASIARIARDLGYHWQEYVYDRVITQNRIHVRSFKFVFVCTNPPYRVRVVEFDDEARTGAEKGLTKAFSMAYAFGRDRIPAELESPTLLLGRKRDPVRNYWDTVPDLHPRFITRIDWNE